MEDTENSAVFTADEARIVASLMEKQLTTPANYPLTINSLMLACDQKSNREPVMDLNEGTVGRVVNHLADRDIVKIEYGDRANRIFHKMRGSFNLDVKSQALLSVMMLRHPQTLNDLRSRTARMTEFSDTNEIKSILDELAAREHPLVMGIPAGAGRREDRYTHLLCGEPDPASLEAGSQSSPKAASGAAASRIEALENRVATLEVRLQALEESLS